MAGLEVWKQYLAGHSAAHNESGFSQQGLHGYGEMNEFVITGDVLREEGISKLKCGGWVRCW